MFGALVRSSVGSVSCLMIAGDMLMRIAMHSLAAMRMNVSE